MDERYYFRSGGGVGDCGMGFYSWKGRGIKMDLILMAVLVIAGMLATFYAFKIFTGNTYTI